LGTNNNSPLPQDKKLTILFRVEAGCLGPKGDQIITDFCRYAHQEKEQIESNYIHWLIDHRVDKSQAEIQYQVGNKTLPREKAEKYLDIFKLKIDDIEDLLSDNLTSLIETYRSLNGNI
jgi:hypothetical protein